MDTFEGVMKNNRMELYLLVIYFISVYAIYLEIQARDDDFDNDPGEFNIIDH